MFGTCIAVHFCMEMVLKNITLLDCMYYTTDI